MLFPEEKPAELCFEALNQDVAQLETLPLQAWIRMQLFISDKKTAAEMFVKRHYQKVRPTWKLWGAHRGSGRETGDVGEWSAVAQGSA